MINKKQQKKEFQLIEKKVNKLILRFQAGVFVLLAFIVISGFFIFSSINLKMIAQALTGNYSKTTGSTLTADEWNNLVNDFGVAGAGIVSIDYNDCSDIAGDIGGAGGTSTSMCATGYVLVGMTLRNNASPSGDQLDWISGRCCKLY